MDKIAKKEKSDALKERITGAKEQAKSRVEYYRNHITFIRVSAKRKKGGLSDSDKRQIETDKLHIATIKADLSGNLKVLQADLERARKA